MTRRSDLMCEDLFGCDHTPETPESRDGQIVGWRCRCGRPVPPPADARPVALPPTFIVERRPAQDTQMHPHAWSQVWSGSSLDEAHRRVDAIRAEQWTEAQVRVEWWPLKGKSR